MNEASLPSLLEAARAAGRAAHAPYSEFPVGAALETVAGTRYVGCNVENASYGLTVCAERVAIFSAVAAGEALGAARARSDAPPPGGRRGTRFIRAMAVSCLRGDPSDPNSLMPCGACRQVMAEFLTEDAAVEVDGVGRFTLADLLPHAFVLPPEGDGLPGREDG